MLGLAPAHAVLVGELTILSGVPDLELPPGWVGRTGSHDTDVGPQQVLHVAIGPSEAEPDIGEVDVRRKAEVFTQPPVRHVVTAGDEGTAEVVGHPVGLAMIQCGQDALTRAHAARSGSWYACIHTPSIRCLAEPDSPCGSSRDYATGAVDSRTMSSTGISCTVGTSSPSSTRKSVAAAARPRS